MTRLEIFREFLKMKPKAMADALDLEYQTYYQYEKGARNTPREVLEKLAEKGLNLNWLATGEGPMTLPVKEVHPGAKGVLRLAPGDLDPAVLTEADMDRLDQVREASRMVFKALHAEGLQGVNPETEDWLIDQLADGLAAGRPRQQLEARLALALDLLRERRQGKGAE